MPQVNHGCCSSGVILPVFWDRLLLTWSSPQKPGWWAMSPRDWPVSTCSVLSHRACSTTLSWISVGSEDSNSGRYPWVISLASVYLKTCLDVMTSFCVVCHCTLYLPTVCLFLPALPCPFPCQVLPLLLLCYQDLYKIVLLVWFNMLITGPAMSLSVV